VKTPRSLPQLPLETLNRAAQLIGAVGALWAVYETLVAFDVLPDGVAFSPFDGREGFSIGLAMVALSIASIAGVLVVRRLPALTATLLFIAACGGFLAVGAPWIMPGVLLAVASWFALLATRNPFQEEIARERAEAAAQAGSSDAGEAGA
jgi:hypothetical protein